MPYSVKEIEPLSFAFLLSAKKRQTELDEIEDHKKKGRLHGKD